MSNGASEKLNNSSRAILLESGRAYFEPGLSDSEPVLFDTTQT